VISEGVYIDFPHNVSLGNNVWLDKGVIIITGKSSRPNINRKSDASCIGKLKIGDNAHVGIRSILQAHGGITIGDSFTSGSEAKIYTLSNDVSLSENGTHNLDKEKLYYRENSIEIGNNVWCGMNTILLAGPIGNNVFLQPNSVCYSAIEENSVVSGNPARKIKSRFT
jgi:acetyltransferase-like isoleucine patch superfamily enzyme